ncbi:DNA polymerase beta superfamily protein [Radiobacillus sp. PE A8.2]|uniref:nucleotidyltransferase domain-containing protein n=1 Tax=Radiobacillus sp. PE A8.2 TaxID=3380349 RepID=UPI00388E515B
MKKPTLSLLEEHTILQVITGSQAYGLASEHSDIDQKAIVILPAVYMLQLGKEWETETFHQPDVEYHSLKKAMNLMDAQNPTIIEMLFVPTQYIVKQTEIGDALRQERQAFLSQNCYYTFGGYAKDQLMRIKNGLNKATKKDHDIHLRYTLERMLEEMPSRYPEFGRDNIHIKDIYLDHNEKQNVDVSLHINQMSLTQLNGVISELSNSTKNYNKVNHRNKKVEEKLTKHAMHLVRLLIMGIEVLKTGKMTVHHTKDKELLLAIRNGAYTWDQLFEMVEELFLELDHAKQVSELPAKTDKEKINKLYFEWIGTKYQMDTT